MLLEVFGEVHARPQLGGGLGPGGLGVGEVSARRGGELDAEDQELEFVIEGPQRESGEEQGAFHGTW
ncbi:MAG: hypothetical protein EAZ65_05960 [Verrucomicrobia bacterium]|nr:MAG: hypothetical protein EAZ84_01505 [Verrucomicrobiota bacterium]TAE87779.1 MAG: hypothetical protein EAZ82_06065 [Verrucomicrobiota bacterium]TAF25522.1 MAG: hypothetical protein EAZ71_06990 [Verrucomicrobiota bacterium]TAF41411.1 MAG: hypothetical protein EAZ65_05960 [Verrucomicrobiota bacterium]